MATLRLVRAAERAGARRFLFFSAMGARHHSRTRFFRAKALAEEAVRGGRRSRRWSSRPSIVYTPGDPWLTLLERFSYLPALPVSGSGRARYQPIWAEDVADCVLAALMATGPRRRSASSWPARRRSPTTTSCARRCAPTGRRRPLLHVPLPVVRASLRALRPLAGPRCSPPGRRPS